ncbi:MAG: hypothetical protein ACK4MS_06630 [Paracoccaceae bacterium]
MDDADRIIAHPGLAPHPEGGWYRQTSVLPKGGGSSTRHRHPVLAQSRRALCWPHPNVICRVVDLIL